MYVHPMRRLLTSAAPTMILLMARKAPARRKPTREQIRGWLAHVLSPMLRALDIEVSFLSQRNWSFRCESLDFEYLWPTGMMVAFPHRATTEQVFRYYPTLGAKTAAHDSTLTELRDQCRALYTAVLQSPQLQELPMPADARPEDRRYFVEYVINGIRDLPAHYAFSEFWKGAGAQYLKLRSDPAMRPSFDSLIATGEALETQANALRNEVKGLQERLADSAGLPPVPGIS